MSPRFVNPTEPEFFIFILHCGKGLCQGQDSRHSVPGFPLQSQTEHCISPSVAGLSKFFFFLSDNSTITIIHLVDLVCLDSKLFRAGAISNVCTVPATTGPGLSRG